jgi:Lon-like ATP-dependent protease
MARSSVDNVCTVLRVRYQIEASDFYVHVNFPGGAPVDGPSAGLAMAVAVLSAVRDIPIDNRLAMTGEISVHGRVKPVGGVVAKVAAAASAGAVRVLIPKENWQGRFEQLEGCRVIPVDDIDEALELVRAEPDASAEQPSIAALPQEVVAARSASP